MNFKQVYIFWTFIGTLTFGLSPPQNVNIIIKDNNVTFTWTLPSEPLKWTYLSVVNGTGRNMVVNKYVKAPETSYTTTVLPPCQQYTVRLRSSDPPGWSEFVMITFWMTDKVFTTNINTDVNLTWTTSLDDFYIVMAPHGAIYSLTGGNINQNSDTTHYKIHSNDLQQIHVSVLNVKQNDGGIYKTVDQKTNSLDVCCLLVITDKPTKPQLTYDRYPFVGFQTDLTCYSEVRRWPRDPQSSLSFSFSVTGEQHNNILTINVTKLNKGKSVYCLATDDKRKQSDSSNVIIPYYGPDNSTISPPAGHVNVTEGDKLHPINCSADCNPNCNYVWKYKTKKIIDGQILKIDKVTRTDSGVYRCNVTHPNSTIRPTYPNGGKRYSNKHVTVNVLYPPKLKRLQFSKGTNSFKDNSTHFHFNEEDRVFVKINIESNPKPRLYFYSQTFPKTELKYTILSQTFYTAELPSLECEDSGQCIIEVNNSIKNSTKKMVHLKIHCKPKHITPERRTIGTQIDALENVTINVVANPEPSVQWITYTEFPWEIQQGDNNYKYKLMSHVRIKKESEFGQYGVRIHNSVGTTNVYITLAPKVDKSGDTRNAIIYTLAGLLVVIIAFLALVMILRRRRRNTVAAQENRRETGNERCMPLDRADLQTDHDKAAQENRKETGNERYMPLDRTDLQIDHHKDNYTELAVVENTNERTSSNNKDDYTDNIYDDCATDMECSTNTEIGEKNVNENQEEN